jgi:3-dehydroquinate synthase
VKTIQIKGGTGDAVILVGESMDGLHRYVPIDNTIIITDTHIAKLYGKRLPPCKVITIEPGESTKSLRTVEHIYQQLLAFGADRSTCLVGIGGGIVCDITGFVASTFMRGLRFGYVATTLLSQVDASVGGKNGVNFKGYKNIVGVFNQPAFVICDLTLLATLPAREVSSGFAEIVKHGAIADVQLFSFIETHAAKALALDLAVIEQLVYESVKIKAAVVNQDELETGERRKLNFGHTFGHAIEKTTGISHGEAVSVGMLIACAVSEAKGLLKTEDTQRLQRVLQDLALPTEIEVDAERVWDALQKDKKREGGSIHFVLLDRIGHAVVRRLSIADVQGGMTFLKSPQHETPSREPASKTDNRHPGSETPALFGVFGDPVCHSLSPVMHTRAFAVSGYQGVYLPFRIDDIAQALAAMKALNMRGASVTLPHKIRVMAHLDHVDEMARKIGAVNTILNQDGILTGYNSDALGAVAALSESGSLEDRRVVIIGAGGAARAVGYGIRENKGRVIVVNRTEKAGQALAADLGGDFCPLSEIQTIDGDMLINTTPVGMFPHVDQTPVPASFFKPHMTVMDIIYTPLESRLLKEAAAAGCETINGLPMFVHQGAFQFECWTGLPAPVETMRTAVSKALALHEA